MPCLFAAIALITPRLLMAYLWFFTHWFYGVFDTVMWPILGFLFAPTSLLWYSVVHNAYDGQWGTLQIVVMVIAVLVDLSPGSGRKRRKTD
jgi:hypothetical protein